MRRYANRSAERQVWHYRGTSTIEHFRGGLPGNLRNVGRDAEEPVENLDTNEKRRFQTDCQKIYLETARLVQQKNKNGQMNRRVGKMESAMIGKRLKTLRKELGWTLKTLAEKCGVSTNTVWRWEQDEQTPTLRLLRTLAETLRTTESFLMGRSDDPTADSFTVIDGLSGRPLSPFLKRIDLRQDEITPRHTITLPVLDLPHSLESGNSDIFRYTACKMTVPLAWIGKLPEKNIPFFFTARGDAMAEAGLRDGFLALANPNEPVSNGDIQLFLVRAKGVYEPVVRWGYVLPGGGMELRCPNPNYPVYRFEADPPRYLPDKAAVMSMGKIAGAWAGSLKRGI
jgi:transcriptional regulator with XRE-family HTH domain